MADQTPDRKMILIEEAERRGRLPANVLSKLREARDKGLVKTTRDAELLDLETKIINTDVNDIDDDRRAAYANTYRKLRFGEHDDYDGRKRYGKKLTSKEYYESIKAELSGANLSDKFKDELSQFNAADDNGKLAKSQELIKKETDKFANRMKVGMQQGTLMMMSSDIADKTSGGFDDASIPDIRSEAEQLANADVNNLDDVQKAKLTELGRQEAFKRSYIPVRKFLEDKLERNPFANKIAQNALISGELNEDEFDILSPETRDFVSQYVRHTRPFTANEGIIGTLNQAGRVALSSAWSVAHTGLRDSTADFVVSGTSALWSVVDPIASTEYIDAWERERKNLRQQGYTFSLKAPERSRLGAAVVGLAETTPHMVALIYGGGAGTLGAGASAAKHARNRAIELGAKPEEANVVAGIAGIASVYVERLGGIGGKTQIGKYLSKPLLARATAKTMVGFTAKNMPRFTERLVRNAGSEWLEEWGEAFINNISEQVFIDFKPSNITKVDFQKALSAATADAVDSSDVTFLMSLLGGGRAFVSDLSTNSAEMTFNKSAMEKIQSQASLYIKNNPDAFLDGVENINDAIIDAWTDNDKTKARELLTNMGISKDALAEAEPSLIALAKAQKSIRKELTESEKRIKAQESRFAELKPVLDRAGVETNFVEQLTDSLDPGNIGQYNGGVIEVRDGIRDKSRVWNHEAFHFAIDHMGLSDAQWEVLRKASDNSKYRKLQIRYADLTGDAKVEDIMADVWADWTPEARTIWKVVYDWARKMVGALNHEDVFRSLDKYVKALDPHSVKPTYKPTIAKQSESAAKGAKFARSESNETQTLNDAAEIYALDKISGRNAAKSAERLSAKTGIDKARIEQAGKHAYDTALSSLEAGADAIAKKVAVRTKAAERRIKSELRKAAKVGAKQAIKVAEKQTKEAVKESKRDRDVKRKAERIMPKSIDRMNVKPTATFSVDSWASSIKTAADVHAEKIGDTSDDVVEAIVKHEMFHQLWQLVRKTKHNNLRSGMMTRMHKMLEVGTSMDDSKALAQAVINRLVEINDKRSKADAKSEFTKLLKSEAGKPMKRNETIIKRSLSQEQHTYLRAVSEVAKLDEDSLKSNKDYIKLTLDMVGEGMGVDLDERINSLTSTFPVIASRETSNMSNLSKLIMLNTLLGSYGGVLEHGTAVQIKEATLGLAEDIQSDEVKLIESANKIYAKVNKGETAFKKILSVAPNKFAKIIGAHGTFSMNIRQQLEQFARAGGKDEKAAVSELMRALDVQDGNTREESLLREMHADVNKIFKDVYSKDLNAMSMEMSDTKQKWAKYNKLNSTPLNLQQMLRIIGDWEQADFRPTLEKKMGYTPEMIDEIRGEVGEKGLKLLAKLRKFYKQSGAIIDDVTLKVHGVKISLDDPNYMPGLRLGIKTYNSMTAHKTPIMPPSFADRTSSTMRMDIEKGVIEMLINKIDETAHFASHAEGAVIANEIFGQRAIADEAIKKHGEDLWTNFTNHLQQVFAGGTVFSDNEKGLRKLASLLAVRGLSGNVPLLPKQLTSIFAPSFRYGLIGLAKEAKSGSQGAVDWLQAFDAIRKSDQWKNRAWSGASELIEDSLRAEYGTSNLDEILKEGKARDVAKFVNKTLRRAYQLGMLPTRAGDIGAIAIISPTIYQAKLREHKGNAEIAMSETWEVIQETQQSKAMKDRNRLIREGGSWAKLAGMFMGTKGQYFAFVSRAVHDYTANPSGENAAKLLNTIATHAILDGAYAMIGMLVAWGAFGDEPDEEWKMQLTSDILAGFAGSMPIQGMIAQAGVERLMLGKSSWGGTDFPFQSLKISAENAADIVKHAYSRDFSEMIDEFNDELGNWIVPWRHLQKATVDRGE